MTDGLTKGFESALSQQTYDHNMDYIIGDYMERLSTRLHILEAELKYAWRALDLLSQEYIKMWERLEKLEGLLFEQQSVIAQLLEFYTSCRMEPGAEATLNLDGKIGQLEVIREILGNGTVEDGLEEGVDVTRGTNQRDAVMIEELDLDLDMGGPDEAFYKSLNQAYRDDLVGCETSRPPSHLGMIWEEAEDGDDLNGGRDELKQLEQEAKRNESQEVYSSMDYKDYRGNSPCISEQDLAQLSRISSIDQIAIEKLNELDKLSNKIQQDSFNIRHLQNKLLESPNQNDISWTQHNDTGSQKEQKSINEQLQKIFSETDPWPYNTPLSVSNRPSSRVSLSDSVGGADNEVAEALAGGMRSPTSPRRRHLDISACSAPYTTVTGRLAYSTAVQNQQNAEAAAAAAAASLLQNSKNPFYSSLDIAALMPASYETVTCVSPVVFNAKSERAISPTSSICSVRTRQDGYINSPTKTRTSQHSPSPPPPAPQGMAETFLMSQSTIVPGPQPAPSPVFLGASTTTPSMSITGQDPTRLSPRTPHSPKSPRTSPKRSKSNIVTAKSDSGLSSMSGWSSLEKSPGSPKNGAVYKPHYSDSKHQLLHNMPASPLAYPMDNLGYAESSVDTIHFPGDNNPVLPGGHHLSAFTTVKSPCTLESSGNFVPAPAPASDINVSPKQNNTQQSTPNSLGEFSYYMDQPAIYSVAGSNRQETYTTVYAGSNSEYLTHTMNYPDLIEPYEHNELSNSHQRIRDSLEGDTTKNTPSSSTSNKKSRTHRAEYDPSTGYRIGSQKNVYPSSNITDSLSYYPIAARHGVNAANYQYQEYRDPATWTCSTDGQIPFDNTSTSSSLPSGDTIESGYSQSPYLDRRDSQLQNRQNNQRLHQHPQLPSEYNNCSGNHRQEIPYLELDLKNKNVPDYVIQQQYASQYYNANPGMISSQYMPLVPEPQISGKESKSGKKLKRGATLKSAMSSVSHWLPDLHITKRNRSYSLPGGGHENVIEERAKSGSRFANGLSTRRKKKNVVVSTVSGIFQKAKKKAHLYHRHSLSDPEQTDAEWSALARASSVVSEDDRSEDSSSLLSENQSERENLFPKASNNKAKTRRQSYHETSIRIKSQLENDKEEDQIDSAFEYVTATSTSPRPLKSIASETDPESEVFNEKDSNKSSENETNSLFITIGDSKKNSVPSDKSDESTTSEGKSFQVSLGGASMEFAVSRALGKYRQRQNSVVCDETAPPEDSEAPEDVAESNVLEEDVQKPEEQVINRSEPIPVIEHNAVSRASSNEDRSIPESSPSAHSFRQFNRMLTRHQQSLEIPGFRGEDDDSRSTHSWRSVSRQSSRRQSTEDSIDSEDEWYCYELRKLEEMERQSHLELELGPSVEEVPEPEEFEPDEEVKEKMSFVLRELRMTAKVVPGILDEEDNRNIVVTAAKHREKFLFEEESLLDEDSNVENDYLPEEYDDTHLRVERAGEDDVRSMGSGETSGPDSPHPSSEEFDDLFARCNVSKPTKEPEPEPVVAEGPVMKKPDEPLPVPEEPVQVSGPVPEIQVEDEDCSKDEPPNKDAGPFGSKWKLLKTLKERKAEEKSKPDSSPVEKDKVSMLGMMQKFYEIHVKT